MSYAVDFSAGRRRSIRLRVAYGDPLDREVLDLGGALAPTSLRAVLP